MDEFNCLFNAADPGEGDLSGVTPDDGAWKTHNGLGRRRAASQKMILKPSLSVILP
jgi:hypothetical protein